MTGRSSGGEGRCPGCGHISLWVRKPLYEGFSKVGEVWVCTACAREFRDNEVTPTPAASAPRVFSRDELPVDTDPFAGDERGRTCRHCVHYVVNPFRQWCGLHRRDVEATDSCERFEQKGTGQRQKPVL